MPEEKKDVDMADVQIKIEEEQKEANIIQVIQAEVSSIVQAVPQVDLRALARVQFAQIKRRITGPVLKRCAEAYVKEEDMRDLFEKVLQKEDSTLEPELEKQLGELTVPKLPEISFFFAILALDFAGNDKFVSQVVVRLGNLNRRTLDSFQAKIYHYFARSFKDTALIRNDLLAIYRTACLRRDVETQATVLNLILRNYMESNLFEQASQLVAKTTFPENRSNAEYARYLFYIGRIRSIQLNYGEAHAKLMQAIRKAPIGATKALGFKTHAWKFALVVELLMGELPDRKHFQQPHLRPYLYPYEAVTNAVRGGSVPEFVSLVNKYETLFRRDGTLTLIHRLRYNVIKTGLRKINISYSRIALKDVSSKLGLESVEDAAGICGKAIADGVIHATLNYQEMSLVSNTAVDVYASAEPHLQLHKRIAFCLQLTNECTKNMEYPEKALDAADADPTKENREREEIMLEMDSDEDIDMI